MLNHITGDGTPSTVWHNRQWKDMPGNSGNDEPQVLLADHIRHYLPASKIIIIVRNPITRSVWDINSIS
jgi:hypothetical protein